jgi:hypothetical protein
MPAPLPSDLARIVSELDASDAHAKALVASLSEAQANWQPEGGRKWSIVQCLEHLTKINDLYGSGMRAACDRARAKARPYRPIAPSLFGRWFIKSQEPPPRLKMPAPPKAVPPPTGASKAQALADFLRTQEAMRQIAIEAATFDPNAARFANPFLGGVRVKVGTALLIIAAHDRRHLWQADRTRERPDFPA